MDIYLTEYDVFKIMEYADPRTFFRMMKISKKLNTFPSQSLVDSKLKESLKSMVVTEHGYTYTYKIFPNGVKNGDGETTFDNYPLLKISSEYINGKGDHEVYYGYLLTPFSLENEEELETFRKKIHKM